MRRTVSNEQSVHALTFKTKMWDKRSWPMYVTYVHKVNIPKFYEIIGQFEIRESFFFLTRLLVSNYANFFRGNSECS